MIIKKEAQASFFIHLMHAQKSLPILHCNDSSVGWVYNKLHSLLYTVAPPPLDPITWIWFASNTDIEKNAPTLAFQFH